MLLILGAPHSRLAADLPQSNRDSAPAPSQLVEGKVTAIIDGDTLHLTAGDTVYLVDLAGIDAPEKGQPSGDMAAQVLHLKVMQKQVQLLVLPDPSTSPNVHPVTPVPAESLQPDPHVARGPLRRRVRGILYSDGCVNWQLIHEGIAWHDPADCPSTSLAQAQESARTARRGLWQAEQQPLPPWQWRQQQSRVAAAGAPASQGREIKDLSRFFEAKTPPSVVEAAAIPAQPAPAPSPPASATVPASTGDCWLTTSSGIRHNSTCRYYKKSKGRPCAANEGQPCQKCGG
jgi:endonuclease YncB( thermonuclease family)